MSEYAKIKTARTIICDLCNELHSDEPCEPADCDWLRMLEEDAGDLVTVVRCEKCAYHEDEEPGMVYCPRILGGWVSNEFFCGEGKRRTNANEPDGA